MIAMTMTKIISRPGPNLINALHLRKMTQIQQICSPVRKHKHPVKPTIKICQSADQKGQVKLSLPI